MLSDSVPVVDHRDARSVDGDDEACKSLSALRVVDRGLHGDEVGESCSSGIEFLAGEHPAGVGGADGRGESASPSRTGPLACGIAEDGTVGDQGTPPITDRPVGQTLDLFDEPVVRPQDVSRDRVGPREIDDELNEFDDIGSATSVFGVECESGESCVTQ